MDDEGFFAQALDADKRPVASITSNPGHVLWSGLADAEKAGLDVDPASADEAMALLHKITSYPPDLLAKAKEAAER